jgi:hypothetical protein
MNKRGNNAPPAYNAPMLPSYNADKSVCKFKVSLSNANSAGLLNTRGLKSKQDEIYSFLDNLSDVVSRYSSGASTSFNRNSLSMNVKHIDGDALDVKISVAKKDYDFIVTIELVKGDNDAFNEVCDYFMRTCNGTKISGGYRRRHKTRRSRHSRRKVRKTKSRRYRK